MFKSTSLELPSTFNPGRRPSFIDSIEVTIVSTSTSTYTPYISQNQTESHHQHLSISIPLNDLSEIEPPPYLDSPPFITSAYNSPPSPLSFFPSFNHSTLELLPPIEELSEDTLPPTYRVVPKTFAQRCFFLGFFCPPIWILGILKLYFPEPIIGKGKHAFTPISILNSNGGRGEGLIGIDGRNSIALPSYYSSSNPLNSLKLWREEELIWSRRCCAALGIFLVVGAVTVLFVLEYDLLVGDY